MASPNVLLQRCVIDGIGYILKACVDSTLIVADANGTERVAIDKDGLKYVPCNIGDTITMFHKEEKANKFKVIGLAQKEQFFVCEQVFTLEDTILASLQDLKIKVDAGELDANKAHLKADDLIMQLLYAKGFKEIADAFVKVPKFYN